MAESSKANRTCSACALDSKPADSTALALARRKLAILPAIFRNFFIENRGSLRKRRLPPWVGPMMKGTHASSLELKSPAVFQGVRAGLPEGPLGHRRQRQRCRL